MTFKESSKKFIYEAIPFLIWGSLLMAFFEKYPAPIQNEIKEIFFESAAFRSIMLLFVISMFSAGFFSGCTWSAQEAQKDSSVLL